MESSVLMLSFLSLEMIIQYERKAYVIKRSSGTPKERSPNSDPARRIKETAIVTAVSIVQGNEAGLLHFPSGKFQRFLSFLSPYSKTGDGSVSYMSYYKVFFLFNKWYNAKSMRTALKTHHIPITVLYNNSTASCIPPGLWKISRY